MKKKKAYHRLCFGLELKIMVKLVLAAEADQGGCTSSSAIFNNALNK